MDRNSRDAYLETQILTASPQKLQLMLIEGALRFARQAVEQSQQAKDDQAHESVTQCRHIIAELVNGVRADDSELAAKVAAVYTYLYQTITEAQLQHRWENLSDVIRVLEVERETWQQVCQQMPEAPPSNAAKTDKEITAADMPPMTPDALPGASLQDGLSLEA